MSPCPSEGIEEKPQVRATRSSHLKLPESCHLGRPGRSVSRCQPPRAGARGWVRTVTPSAELPSLCQVKCLAPSSAAVAMVVTSDRLAAENSLSHSNTINFDPVVVSLVTRSGGFSSSPLNSLSQHGFTPASQSLLQLDQGGGDTVVCQKPQQDADFAGVVELLFPRGFKVPNTYFHS